MPVWREPCKEQGVTNFIFILADDLGHADLGCYGGLADTSPNLDRLARQGLRFTRAYANSPVCSPTRFALMTGRYQYRLRGGAEEPLTPRFKGDKVVGLPPEHPTLPSLLWEQGYRTALIGKWHLGYPPHFGPLHSGYEQHWGILSGGADYLRHTDNNGEGALYQDGQPVQAQGYLTDLLSERAVQYVRQRGQDKAPFLLSLHYTAPHWPWQTRAMSQTGDYTFPARLSDLESGSIHIYRQMIREMDEGIGALCVALQECGLLHDTLIVFTSDNGGERYSNNWPLVGGKMDLTEGGIRVPQVVHWPAVVRPGITDVPCMTMDWAPTFWDLAGVRPPSEYEPDGTSLVSLLRGVGAPDPTRSLFWRMKHRAQHALIQGDWKYLKVDEYEYLFDLAQDERERSNLARREPQRLQRMRDTYLQWADSMPAIPAQARADLVYGPADMPAR